MGNIHLPDGLPYFQATEHPPLNSYKYPTFFWGVILTNPLPFKRFSPTALRRHTSYFHHGGTPSTYSLRKS